MVLLRHTISTMYHGIIFKSCKKNTIYYNEVCHRRTNKESVQWRSEGGAGGGICPRAPPGGGRQNPDKEFFKIYILRNFEKSERIQ